MSKAKTTKTRKPMSAEHKAYLSVKAKERSAAKKVKEAEDAEKLARAEEIIAAHDAGDEVTEEVSSKVAPKVASKVKVKTGSKPWAPARLLDVRNKTPGFRYRWATNDSDNLRRKQEEDWVFVNKTSGLKGDHDRPDNVIDGGPMTSDDTSYRDVTLMALPEERAKERDEYQKQKVREQGQETARELREKAKKLGNTPGESPQLHGSITFE